MKRFVLILTSFILCAAFLTACKLNYDVPLGSLAYGLLGRPMQSTAQTAGSADIIPTEQAQASEDIRPAQQLSTENDTFHLNMLCQLMQTTDSGVVEMLGQDTTPSYDAEGSIVSRAYQGTLYSHNLRFTVYYDDLANVTSIDAEFDGIDAGIADYALSITSTLEREPVEGYRWDNDLTTVVLEQADGRVLMHITEETEVLAAD